MSYINYQNNLNDVIFFIKKHTGEIVKIEKDEKNHFGLVFIFGNKTKIEIVFGDVIFYKSKKIQVLTAKEFTKKMIIKRHIVH